MFKTGQNCPLDISGRPREITRNSRDLPRTSPSHPQVVLRCPQPGPKRDAFLLLFRDRRLEATLLALVNFPRRGHGRFQEVLRLNKTQHRRQKSSARSFKTLPKYVVVGFKKPKSCLDNFDVIRGQLSKTKLNLLRNSRFKFVLNAPRKPFFDNIDQNTRSMFEKKFVICYQNSSLEYVQNVARQPKTP